MPCPLSTHCGHWLLATFGYSGSMLGTVEEVASYWIAYARLGPDSAPEQVFADGWALVELVWDDPAAAWEVIKAVVRHYTLDEYYSISRTEAQEVVGLLAAGPIEDLLSEKGSLFISAIETEAATDKRFAWALGGVWQSTTPDDIWARVRRVADDSYWERPSVE